MRKLIATITIALLLTGIWSAAPVSPARAASPGEEAAFVARINQLRASKGLAPLAVHGSLVGVARSWADTMAGAGNIWHNPGLASQVAADWQKLGENVGVGGDVGSLFDAFVASPSHYRNLVDPAFTHIGVGVTWAGGRMYTAHEFMALAVAPPAPPPPPPPPPPSPPVTPPPPPPAPAAPTAPTGGSTAARPVASAPAPVGAAPASSPGPADAAAEPAPMVVPAVLAGLRSFDER
jgi:hypothetical protein